MNIVFLDVDGVLNNLNDAIAFRNKYNRAFGSGFDWPFNKESMECLRKIVLKSDARIVIVSTWRKSPEGRRILTNKLKEYGLADRIEGSVSDLARTFTYSRGYEIYDFLTKYPNSNFVILDDESYRDFTNIVGLDLTKHLVYLDRFVGLKKKHVKYALKILNSKF